MEFIKRLANNLFGKRKTYDAKELGIFYSKVWNCWKNESYYWFTSMKFPVYREETFLWLKWRFRCSISATDILPERGTQQLGRNTQSDKQNYT